MTAVDRDFEKNPYSKDEQRVCDFLQTIAPDVGCGDDPIGFLIASYHYLIIQRKEEEHLIT